MQKSCVRGNQNKLNHEERIRHRGPVPFTDAAPPMPPVKPIKEGGSD